MKGVMRMPGITWWRQLAAAICAAAVLAGSLSGQTRVEWRIAALAELCEKYVGGNANDVAAQPRQWLEKLASAVGERLSKMGTGGVPAEDLAAVAMLIAQQSAGKIGAPETKVAAAEAPKPAPPPPADPQVKNQVGAGTLADIGKGQEGMRQGIDRLAKLPLSERLVITGDVTAGLQAATVAGASDQTSAFGRFRVNFVARATEGMGRLGAGYFFVQMRAAGGPFDTSVVGGPSAFSALNDVATDRSRYNEGTSRGNLYLAKAFYQQEARLWKGDLTARTGVINFSDFFDTNVFANNEVRQFLNSSLVNNPGYKGGISAPGLMGEYRRSAGKDWLQSIALRTGYGLSQTARAFSSPLLSAEAELQTAFRQRQGHYRMGGSTGNVAGLGGVFGIYLNFDQWVSREYGVWGRFGFSNGGPGSASLGRARQSYSGGWQWRITGTDDLISALGVGFSQTFGIDTGEALASERVLETYYRWQVARLFSLSPDVQLVLGSGGNRTRGTHLVLGLRLYYGF